MGVGGKGNDGVAAVVAAATEGSHRLRRARLRHPQTYNDHGSAEEQLGQLHRPQPGEHLGSRRGRPSYRRHERCPVSDSANPEAYPIVTGTYILAYDKMPDAAKAGLSKPSCLGLGDEGTAIAEELGYAPLPERAQSPGSCQGRADQREVAGDCSRS